MEEMKGLERGIGMITDVPEVRIEIRSIGAKIMVRIETKEEIEIDEDTRVEVAVEAGAEAEAEAALGVGVGVGVGARADEKVAKAHLIETVIKIEKQVVPLPELHHSTPPIPYHLPHLAIQSLLQRNLKWPVHCLPTSSP